MIITLDNYFKTVNTPVNTKRGLMTYETSTKNQDKPEFDFGNNRNCLDYNIEYAGEVLSGSYCNIDGVEYVEIYGEFDETPYEAEEFKKESRKLVKKFLNLKNKKQYETDSIVYENTIKLWNMETDDQDEFKWELRLTYCP